MYSKYVKFELSENSKNQFREIASSYSISNFNDDLHVTLLESKKDFAWAPIVYNPPLVVDVSSWYILKQDEKNILMLLLNDDWLAIRHKLAISNGAESRFENYLQHITVSYDYSLKPNWYRMPKPPFVELIKETVVINQEAM